MWGFIVKGGPVMIPIIIGSIIGLAIILEKLWMLNRLKINTAAFADEVFQNIRSNKVQKALGSATIISTIPLPRCSRSGSNAGRRLRSASRRSWSRRAIRRCSGLRSGSEAWRPSRASNR